VSPAPPNKPLVLKKSPLKQ